MKNLVFSQPDGLALGEETDFEVLNCLPALNLIRSIKLPSSTEPAFLPNACYAFALLVRIFDLGLNYSSPFFFRSSFHSFSASTKGLCQSQSSCNVLMSEGTGFDSLKASSIVIGKLC